jgi:hypothetical protein
MPNNRQSTFLENLERRKAGRIRCSQTLCQLGPIADLSRDGCRVISKKPLSVPEGKSVILRINVAGIELSVPAQQVSCRARRDGKHDVGFRFVAVADESRRELMNVLRAALSSPEHLHRMSA